MNVLLLIQAAVMGTVEGLTEFLPVSSTGHLIIVGELLDFLGAANKRDVFDIAIQLGAILAVCWEYRHRLSAVVSHFRDADSQGFMLNITIAFLPAALLGCVLIDTIKHYLFHPLPVAIALIFGGVMILWAEKREHTIVVCSVSELRWRDSLKIGIAQALSLIPGVSRSGATIVGGLFFGLSRQAATEFSFFLAIPIMFAATAFDLARNYHLLNSSDVPVFVAGFMSAFVSALLTVRALLRYVQKHDLTPFAWYRIALGAIILIVSLVSVSP